MSTRYPKQQQQKRKATETLSDEQTRALRNAFKLFDKDGDGTITCEELKEVMLSVGQHQSANEIAELVQKVDADGNGVIDFDEFVQIMKHSNTEVDPDLEIREAWEVLSNGEQYASREMVRTVLTNLGENINGDDALDNLIAEADHDGDGKINYDDFYKTMKSNLPDVL